MKYLFAEEEFITLLALAEQKNMYMFCQEEDLSEAAIVSSVAELYRRKLVAPREGKMVLSGEMAELVEIMSSSRHAVMVTFAEENFGQQIIYPGRGERAVVMEKQTGSGRPVIKLWPARAEEYVRDLLEEERFPRSLTTGREEAAALEKTALKERPEGYGPEDVSVEIRRLGEGSDRRIDVFRSPVFTWIHIATGDQDSYHVYSAEEIAGLLLSEIKGEEI